MGAHSNMQVTCKLYSQNPTAAGESSSQTEPCHSVQPAAAMHACLHACLVQDANFCLEQASGNLSSTIGSSSVHNDGRECCTSLLRITGRAERECGVACIPACHSHAAGLAGIFMDNGLMSV